MAEVYIVKDRSLLKITIDQKFIAVGLLITLHVRFSASRIRVVFGDLSEPAVSDVQATSLIDKFVKDIFPSKPA